MFYIAQLSWELPSGNPPALQTSAFTRPRPISAALDGALGDQLVEGSSSLRVCKPIAVHVKTVPKVDQYCSHFTLQHFSNITERSTNSFETIESALLLINSTGLSDMWRSQNNLIGLQDLHELILFFSSSDSLINVQGIKLPTTQLTCKMFELSGPGKFPVLPSCNVNLFMWHNYTTRQFQSFTKDIKCTKS